MPIDFYYYPLSPPCRSVIITAKLLNIDLNPIVINLQNGDALTPEYLKMNPQHCIPTIVDGDLVLWESRAIVAYLCNQYAPDSDLYPKDPKKRAVVDRMLNFDQELFYPAMTARFFSLLLTGKDPTPEKIKNCEEMLKQLDTLIGDNKYAAGDTLTIADICIVTIIINFEMIFHDFSSVPNVKNWYERIHKNLILDDMRKDLILEYKKYICGNLWPEKILDNDWIWWFIIKSMSLFRYI